MAEVQALEQRFESITVQDENLDINTAIAAQQKQKVYIRRHRPSMRRAQLTSDATGFIIPRHLPHKSQRLNNRNRTADPSETPTAETPT